MAALRRIKSIDGVCESMVSSQLLKNISVIELFTILKEQ